MQQLYLRRSWAVQPCLGFLPAGLCIGNTKEIYFKYFNCIKHLNFQLIPRLLDVLLLVSL